MQNINSRWNKLVTGLITNIGWLIVIVLSVLVVLFTQLGTTHRNEPGETASFEGLFNTYDRFGKLKRVTWVPGTAPTDEDVQAGLTIEMGRYLQDKITAFGATIMRLEKIVSDGGSLTSSQLKELENARKSESTWMDWYQWLDQAEMGTNQGILSGDPMWKDHSLNQFMWSAEYRVDKIISRVKVDPWTWILVILIMFSSIVIKIQGNKTGKISGFKLVWKATARHATLSEKIAPRSVEAEEICIRMNEDELKRKRITRLQYVALEYSDVFSEDGTFINSPKFTTVDISSYTKPNGKTIFKENNYQKKLLKKQKKEVKRLRKFRIKEVHTYILLESKSEAKERFDFGESIKTRDRRTTSTNILTSLIAALPMFTAASVFVLEQNTTSLMIGLAGVILNFGSLLFNMFGAYDYIINSWAPNVVKKCDTLLSIAIELGVADEIDKNWDATIEKEMIANSKK